MTFFPTLALICFFTLALFVLPALPRWIWLCLLMTALMTTDFGMVRGPDERDPCQKKCEEMLGKSSKLFLTREYCIDHCRGLR